MQNYTSETRIGNKWQHCIFILPSPSGLNLSASKELAFQWKARIPMQVPRSAEHHPQDNGPLTGKIIRMFERGCSERSWSEAQD